ncbi:uncharacterized protein V6R79_008702 [Siganus canaliculatus]
MDGAGRSDGGGEERGREGVKGGRTYGDEEGAEPTDADECRSSWCFLPGVARLLEQHFPFTTPPQRQRQHMAASSVAFSLRLSPSL